MSIARQCALLGVARSSLYYRSKEPSGENLALMQAMDRQYLDTPFYGSRRMKVWLAREGRRVSRKRVQRLMRITALRARRYDSTWYIPGTIHGVDYDPMDGTDLSSQSAIYPPAWSDLTPPITLPAKTAENFSNSSEGEPGCAHLQAYTCSAFPKNQKPLSMSTRLTTLIDETVTPIPSCFALTLCTACSFVAFPLWNDMTPSPP